jgi:hypothetical protein
MGTCGLMVEDMIEVQVPQAPPTTTFPSFRTSGPDAGRPRRSGSPAAHLPHRPAVREPAGPDEDPTSGMCGCPAGNLGPLSAGVSRPATAARWPDLLAVHTGKRPGPSRPAAARYTEFDKRAGSHSLRHAVSSNLRSSANSKE